MRAVAAALLLALLMACSTLPVPAAPRGAGDADAAWARVLADDVDERGRVDFAGLAAHRGDLDAYVAHIAATPPDSIVDPKRRLAYLINAYNALAMYGVLEAEIPDRLDLLGRVDFFRLQHVVIGGQTISLYDLENDRIRPIGDERVHFALNCMVVSCPRLPRLPFDGAHLDRQLDQAAREFFAEPRNLTIDPARREIRVSKILNFYTDQIEATVGTLERMLLIAPKEPLLWLEVGGHYARLGNLRAAIDAADRTRSLAGEERLRQRAEALLQELKGKLN